MSEFNQYLRDAGIDPEQTALCFHKPVARAFARFLPYIAGHEPALLEAYQCSHSDRAAAILAGRRYMASFVETADRHMVFVGLFQVNGAQQRPMAEICAIPEVQQLYRDYAVDEEFFDGFTQSWLWFDLSRAAALADLAGRLQIDRPEPQDYMQRAERITVPVLTVAEHSLLNVPVPAWDQLVMVAREVMSAPLPWRQELSGWQGIYFITNEHGGARYVGATEPGQGILPSWHAHIAGTVQGSEKLKLHNPAHFRFSILERLPDDVSAADLLARKASWVARLGTADFGLNRR